MTTTRTTSSHTDCTHEKTKAARAMCRKASQAGITVEEMAKRRIQDNATDSAKAKIRAKAKSAAEPEAEPEGPTTHAEALSGFCGNGTHDRCPGAGKQWACTCDCH